jgi:recombination DNA repair RAD52 pathway protein
MLNDTQYEQLLKPLNSARVAKRSGGGRQLSYLEAWDVKAHLNRIFGFLNWSADVQDSVLAFEEKNEKGQWHVGYKVTLTLSFPRHICTYTESAVGFASLPSRGEAHDMAIKTAESDALKRAAINLGTQFGLSLYNNGATADVIGKTLDRDTVSQGEPAIPVTEISETVSDSPGAAEWIESMKQAIADKDLEALLNLKKAMNSDKVAENVYQGVTLAKWLDKAVAQVGKDK